MTDTPDLPNRRQAARPTASPADTAHDAAGAAVGVEFTPAAAPGAPAARSVAAGVAAPDATGADGLEVRLRTALGDLDRERETHRSEFLFRIATAVLGAVVLIIASGLAALGTFGSGLQAPGPEFYVAPPLAAAGLFGYWANQARRRYASAYKTRVLPAIAGALGAFRYEETGKIAIERLRASALLASFEEYNSADMFIGSYKGADVELAEVELIRKKRSGESRKTDTVFKGLFVLISTHKAISGKTVVRCDAGTIGNWQVGMLGSLERVRLEDTQFEKHYVEKHYEVYTTEQIEARTLLTPAFMERLAALAADIGGGELQAAFYEDLLFVMVPAAKNPLKPKSIFTSVLRDTAIARVAREFSDVLSIIDTLRLDERTGS